MNAAPALAINDANLQWRVTTQEPGHPDVTQFHTGLYNAYTASTAPVRQEQDPVWLIPDFAYVRDMLADNPDIAQTVASHADGRTILLSRV